MSLDELLGRNLKYLRELSGLSLTKMAKLSGMSYRTLKSIENGGYAGNVRLKQLKIIYKNFGIPCSLMLDDRPDMIKRLYITNGMSTEERIDYFLKIQHV